MSDHYYDPGTGDHVMLDGNIVERDALMIAEAIKDYDPNLEIFCLCPERAEGISEEPFVIAELCSDGVYRPVMKVWQLDGTILTRLQLADTQKLDVFNSLVKMEEDQKKADHSRYRDIMDENKDIVAHIAGMRSKYTVRDTRTGDLLTFYDDRPAKRS